MRLSEPTSSRMPIVIAILPLVGLLSGCQTLQAQSRVDPQTMAVYTQLSGGDGSCNAAKLENDSRTGAINLDCLQFPAEFGPDGRPRLAYAAAQNDKVSRNRLAAILMKQSDDVCTLELGRLTANEAMANTGLSIATSALSAAGSIVTGTLAQSILAGGAGLSNASRDHINAEIYRNTLSTAVTKAIQNERDRQRGLIAAKATSLPEVYSVDEMIMDVNRYHQTCSFYRGLGLVVQAVERTRPTYSDEHRIISNAITELDVRVGQIDMQLGAMSKDDGRRAGLETQRGALTEQNTELIKKKSNLSSAQAASGAKSEDTVEK